MLRSRSNPVHWQALAVRKRGDERLLTAFPVSHASDFGNRPSLIVSRSSAAGDLEPLVL